MSPPTSQNQQSSSRTITIPRVEIPTLHLVSGEEKKKSRKPRRKVEWDKKVIDNEHLNRKKTKICCIFRPQNDSDYECESSSDSDSSSSSSSSLSSSSDSDGDDSGAPNGIKGNPEHSEPNAYEIQPKYTKKKPEYPSDGNGNTK